MTTMDLNSDLGESFGAWRMGDDEAILRVVTSANVACGFHAGDPAGILATVRAAVAQGVTIGAHVAYPDLVGFGRRNMDVTSAELQADVMYQIGALQGLATAAGTRVRYVKPHGALYNTIAHDERQAKAVIAAVRAVDPTLVLVALAGAPLVQWARDGHRRQPGACRCPVHLCARRQRRCGGDGASRARRPGARRRGAALLCRPCMKPLA